MCEWTWLPPKTQVLCLGSQKNWSIKQMQVKAPFIESYIQDYDTDSHGRAMYYFYGKGY